MQALFPDDQFEHGDFISSLVHCGTNQNQFSHVNIPLTMLLLGHMHDNINIGFGEGIDSLKVTGSNMVVAEREIWMCLFKHVKYHLYNLTPYPVVRQLPPYHPHHMKFKDDPVVRSSVVTDPHAGGFCGAYAMCAAIRGFKTQNEVASLIPDDLVILLKTLRDWIRDNCYKIRTNLQILWELLLWYDQVVPGNEKDATFSWQFAVKLFHKKLACKGDYTSREQLDVCRFGSLAFSMSVAANLCDAIIVLGALTVSPFYRIDIFLQQTLDHPLDNDNRIVVLYLFENHFYWLPWRTLDNDLRDEINEQVQRSVTLMRGRAEMLIEVDFFFVYASFYTSFRIL